jgi:predicted TIM-barrel fold metal-dependent hydrolase
MEPEVMAQILEPIGRDWVIDMLAGFRQSETFEADQQRAHDDPWVVKGLAALGSTDSATRVTAMDRMGIARQLAFPNTLGIEGRMSTAEAWAVVRNYNDYCLRWTRDSGGRSIGVCQINLTDPAKAVAEARRVIDAGAKGVCVSFAPPPGGTSPANPVWDDLWHLLADARVPLLAHLGATGQFSAEKDDPMLLPRELWDSPRCARPSPTSPAPRSGSVRSGRSSRRSAWRSC